MAFLEAINKFQFLFCTLVLIGLCIVGDDWQYYADGFSLDPYQPNTIPSRKEWLDQSAATFASLVIGSMSTVLLSFPEATEATSVVNNYVQELERSKTKLQPIPGLLQEQKWDDVRTILKTPPVNYLWNLGDSSNTVLKLAKETGNVDLFELKEDLAYNLQMCDQLTYDNVFVYFQPGNGKIKIKEPTDFINKAMKQLDDIIAESSN